MTYRAHLAPVAINRLAGADATQNKRTLISSGAGRQRRRCPLEKMRNMQDMQSKIRGLDEIIATQSAVNAAGQPRAAAIEGGQFRPTRPIPHEDGAVTEVARASWPELAPVVQVHITTTLPGRVRAWGFHQESTDRLFVVSGLIQFVIFDGRESSPTFGKLFELKV